MSLNRCEILVKIKLGEHSESHYSVEAEVLTFPSLDSSGLVYDKMLDQAKVICKLLSETIDKIMNPISPDTGMVH